MSAKGSKLLPGPTIELGLFLPLSVAPHGQTLLASCSLGDFLPIRHDLCLFWSWFLFHLHHSIEDFLGLLYGLRLLWSSFLFLLQTGVSLLGRLPSFPARPSSLLQLVSSPPSFSGFP
jgi:hypothetical protein